MKFGMLRADSGLFPVTVIELESGQDFVYVDLCAVDPGLPRSLTEILAIPDGLRRAGRATQQGLEQGKFLQGKLACPITRPEKVICIGLNYRDHAAETGAKIPTEPICFGKFANTLIGPGDAIQIPTVSQKVDYEAELVVVIGQMAKNVAAVDAMKYIAGYMVGHDVSARDWQKGRPGGQWMLGKTPDSFAPIGPFLVTADEIEDPHQLKIALRLNGRTMQDGSTADLIFPIPDLIAHLSQLLTLRPGDLIFTGTPAGVGDARNPPVYLQPGDTVEVEIEKLGCLTNPVVAE